MRVLVTGADGFLGRNLVNYLSSSLDIEVLSFTRKQGTQDLQALCGKCQFVFHLAGVQRPKEKADFVVGNVDLTRLLLGFLEASGSKADIFFSSSIQAASDNEYGLTKRLAEAELEYYGRRTGRGVFVYRLPHVFGKWGKPNFNSAVNTFCHNVARGIPIMVNDPSTELTLLYVDDLLAEMNECMRGRRQPGAVHDTLACTHRVRLGAVVAALGDFKAGSRPSELMSEFEQKLYAAFLSYRDPD